jgi:hypothetical protein
MYRWENSGTVQSQYEIWPGPEEKIGEDAIIFDPNPGTGLLKNPVFTEGFETLERLGDISIPLGQEKREFSVYLGRNLKSWKTVKPE